MKNQEIPEADDEKAFNDTLKRMLATKPDPKTGKRAEEQPSDAKAKKESDA